MIEKFKSRLEGIENTIGICEDTYIKIKEGKMFCPEELKEGMLEINLKMVENLNIRKEELENALDILTPTIISTPGVVAITPDGDTVRLNDEIKELWREQSDGSLEVSRDGGQTFQINPPEGGPPPETPFGNVTDGLGEIPEEDRGKNIEKLKEFAESTVPKWIPKVGDKVRVKTWEELGNLPGCLEDTDYDLRFEKQFFTRAMKGYCDKVFMIKELEGVSCKIDNYSITGYECNFLCEWLECLPNED